MGQEGLAAPISWPRAARRITRPGGPLRVLLCDLVSAELLRLVEALAALEGREVERDALAVVLAAEGG